MVIWWTEAKRLVRFCSSLTLLSWSEQKVGSRTVICHNQQKPIFYLLSVLTMALVLAMTPLTATAVTYSVFTLDNVFYPDGLSPGQEFTLAVGDTVEWGHLASSVHTIVADTIQGDFQGNVCYEPGGLMGILYEHGQFYFHTFTVPQPCYYRCTL